MIRNDGIQTNSKSKTSCADSNLRSRCDASGTSKNLSRLRPRDEARKSKIRRLGGGTGGSKSYGSTLWSLRGVRNFYKLLFNLTVVSSNLENDFLLTSNRATTLKLHSGSHPGPSRLIFVGIGSRTAVIRFRNLTISPQLQTPMLRGLVNAQSNLKCRFIS
ncbi:hypothetical protein AVEN_220294-1 [Araneus ventricosus]|uniref:Uncharacterized protein n=1 Tax=Araneus ventricosus TaxID=182803 RepID=A0A4Y2EFL7_ARAVE|nr:hypothetical protein AVEN_16367-1 [Araneus ventricosus]GBM27727.1 hypothetical protein AVEN_220294-1 [Araneus ventricosus]